MSDLFRNAVEEYLQPYEGKFNYENMLTNHLDVSRFQTWVNQIKRFRNIEGAVVLSSGCGSGGDMYCFLENGAQKAVGIEIEMGLLQLARTRFASSEYCHLTTVILYLGRVLPFQDQSFDIVFSMHVLEHVEDFALYLSETLRVLKPGGILFLEIPSRYHPIEQHTEIPFIHWLPVYKKDDWIRKMINGRVGRIFTPQWNYRLGCMTAIHIPWPHTLLKAVETHLQNGKFVLRAAGFYSRPDAVDDFQWRLYPWKIPFWSRKATFRVVVQRCQ